MKKNKYLLLVSLFTTIISVAQQRHTLSGTVYDIESTETMIGVTILIPELDTGTTTNEYGFYSITVPEGSYTIYVSYIGYEDQEFTATLTENVRKNISMKIALEELQEVVVTKDVEKLNIRKPEMSLNKLSIQTIKQMPVVLGEVDVIKSILLLPGVTNAGEGASGFNVRGGAADQNLILLDEAIIFNSSHLFGLFSVFNPDAIKDVGLYKGGIPARYGGRVSSVLEIYQKDGNRTGFHMNGGIGAVSSRLLAEGPIVKDRGSFLLAGRASYAHLFLKLTDNSSSAYFYDLNTKISYQLDEKNSLYLSGYFGRDVFELGDSFINTYGNAVGNLRWTHLFSDKLFSNLSLIYSDYFYGLDLNFVGLNWESSIQNINLKYDLKHYLSDNFKLNYGFNNIYYMFDPGKVTPNSPESGINEQKLIDKYANETAVYIEAEHILSPKLSLQYGLRFSYFMRLGQDELNIYENDNPVLFNQQFQIYQSAEPIGVETFSRSDVIKSFNNLEPRINLSYAFNDNVAVKASYNRMAQYLHLLSNTSSPTPLDIWTPSGKYVKPQLLDQFALGFFQNFKGGRYSLQTEVFYKEIDNRIDYIDGADLIANDAIERVILNGESRAYGWEVLLKKNNGRLQGWIGYTLSRSEQRTPGRTTEEPGINNGEWYLTPFDKTHDISVSGTYLVNNKWRFNANFVYQTGQPANFPVAQYEYLGLVVPTFGERNTNRLPSFHRLDVAAIYIPRPEKNKGWRGEWVFGIYNLYNRRNAASITFQENTDTGVNEAIRFAFFGIVPYVSYNFRF